MSRNGFVIILLRLEGLALGLICVWLYRHAGGSWWLFAALILAPDISILGYLAGSRAGAVVYNIVHSWVTVAIWLALCWYLSPTGGTWVLLPLILGAHIGFDRSLGYGLKLPSGFKDTHLGRIGHGA